MNVHIGSVFSRLTVESDDGRYAICKCACGTEGRRVLLRSLQSGNTRSCGCLQRDEAARIGRGHRKHDQAHRAEYKTWLGLRSRCNSPGDADYPNYGARGISVCTRWSDFSKFLEDMGCRPAGMSIDRIDADGNYEPENCRWATAQQQTRNRRIAITVEFKGKQRYLQDLCDEHGISYSTVHSRIRKHGWPLAEALTAPAYARLKSISKEARL